MLTALTARRCLRLLLLPFLLITQIHTLVAHAEEDNTSATVFRPFNLKRSGEIQGGRGVSGRPEFSPDGARIVYSFAASTGQTLALYSVPTRRGDPVLLSASVATGATRDSVIITPDGSHVVYRDSGPNATNIVGVELFSVPIQGGASIRLNGPLPSAGNYRSVEQVAVTPDSKHALYVAPLAGGNGSALYRVPVTGGAPQQLSGAHGATAWVASFLMSQDGSTAVYYSIASAGAVRELYAVSVAGGAPVKIGAALPADRDLGDVVLSANGTVVAFTFVKSSAGTDREIAIYSAQTATGAATLLAEGHTSPFNIPLVGGLPGQVRLTPDGSRVVYLLKAGSNLPFELFSIPTGGGVPAILNVALQGSVSSLGVRTFVIAPDGSRVLYIVRTALAEGSRVYSVPPTGGASQSLGGVAAAPGDIGQLAVSPDSSQVVYSTFVEVDPALFAVPAGGGTPQRLTQPLVDGGQFRALEIGPDGDAVYYVAAQEMAEVDELFRVPMTGGTSQKLNGLLTEAGDVAFTRWSISPNGSAVAYVADQEVDESFELYTTFDVPAVLIPVVQN